MKLSNAALKSPAWNAAKAGPTNAGPSSTLAGTFESAAGGRLQQCQATYELRPLNGEREADLAARRVADPVNPLEAEPFGERSGMSRMVAQREVPRRLKLTISGTTKSDHTKAVELLTFADESEPVAEYTGVNEKDCIAVPAFCEFDLNIIDADTLPRFRSFVHVRAILLRTTQCAVTAYGFASCPIV
jgi:hypothetical protein